METVLAVDTSKVQKYLKSKKYSLLVENKDDILQTIYSNYKFLTRNKIEDDLNYRQIIPYCLLNFGEKYILFERLKKQSETRLHLKFSLGAGGHINEQDDASQPYRIIENCIQRELDEEILVNYNISNDITYIGAINDEMSEVSKSHLGLLFEIKLKDSCFQVKETNKMTAQWLSVEDICLKYDALENWSKITLNQYINIV